ncbi:hypothetical protein [Acuticoccus sediminis]|uniref:hypothetical protein n=1 Tax=Acuticoccus sediminis TaxID=2184697 RepID=UPI001CFEB5FA|nr:hypothetical protein [Acuticoccus sediminis]
MTLTVLGLTAAILAAITLPLAFIAIREPDTRSGAPAVEIALLCALVAVWLMFDKFETLLTL